MGLSLPLCPNGDGQLISQAFKIRVLSFRAELVCAKTVACPSQVKRSGRTAAQENRHQSLRNPKVIALCES
jgi:hypothetical protein